MARTSNLSYLLLFISALSSICVIHQHCSNNIFIFSISFLHAPGVHYLKFSWNSMTDGKAKNRQTNEQEDDFPYFQIWLWCARDCRLKNSDRVNQFWRIGGGGVRRPSITRLSLPAIFGSDVLKETFWICSQMKLIMRKGDLCWFPPFYDRCSEWPIVHSTKWIRLPIWSNWRYVQKQSNYSKARFNELSVSKAVDHL